MVNNYISRKEDIILNAISIINELGIDGLSIRELAKRENITEAALYRHFKSKNDIITAVLNYYSGFDDSIIATIKKNKLNFKGSLLFFINSYAEYYENYQEITAVACSYESLIYDPCFKKNILSIIDKKFEFLKSIIEKGKQNNEIPGTVNSDNFAFIIMGTFKYLIFDWRIKNYSFSLKEMALELVTNVLDSQKIL